MPCMLPAHHANRMARAKPALQPKPRENKAIVGVRRAQTTSAVQFKSSAL